MEEDEIPGVIAFIQEIFPNADVEIQEDDIVYIAELKKEIVGFAHLRILNDKILLNGIGTKKGYRGKHIATQLLEFLVENIKDTPIFLKVKEHNFIAQHVYEKYGFLTKRYGDSHILVKNPEN